MVIAFPFAFFSWTQKSHTCQSMHRTEATCIQACTIIIIIILFYTVPNVFSLQHTPVMHTSKIMMSSPQNTFTANDQLQTQCISHEVRSIIIIEWEYRPRWPTDSDTVHKIRKNRNRCMWWSRIFEFEYWESLIGSRHSLNFDLLYSGYSHIWHTWSCVGSLDGAPLVVEVVQVSTWLYCWCWSG